MNEHENATVTEEATVAKQADEKPATTRPQANTISRPRDVAAVVMARMNALNAKKDELTVAMKGLTDLTQQLMQAYAQNVQIIQQLSMRLKAMEETAGSKGTNQQETVGSI